MKRFVESSNTTLCRPGKGAMAVWLTDTRGTSSLSLLSECQVIMQRCFWILMQCGHKIHSSMRMYGPMIAA